MDRGGNADKGSSFSCSFLSASPECSTAFVQSGGVTLIANLRALADPDADFEAGVPRQAVTTLSQFCGDSPSAELCAAVKCVPR